jgi:DNA polymerase IIIc chi subunit
MQHQSVALKEVMFHTGVADVAGHVARLAARVLRNQESMVVLCQPSEINAIDEALWGSGRTDFLAHSRPEASAAVHVHSPIALVTSLDQLPQLDPAQGPSSSACGPGARFRLLSTLQEWVPGCEAFEKLIEVVTPQGTTQARARWKQFAQMGVALSNTAIGP